MSFTNAIIAGYDIDADKFHAGRKHKRGSKDFVVSQSMLKAFTACPKKWRSGTDRESTNAMEWGTLVDAILLGTNSTSKYQVAPATYPDLKTKKQKPWRWDAAYCREWKEIQEERGYITVKEADWEEAHIAASMMRKDPVVGPMLQASRRQVLITATWNDGPTGLQIPVSAIIDIVPDKGSQQYGKSLADLKCTEAMTITGWQKQVWTMGYHAQAAIYLDLYNQATGEKRNQFHHPIQDSEPPYIVGRRSLSHEFIKMGRDRYRSDLERYARCLATGEWPDFDDQAESINGWVHTDPAEWMIHQETPGPYRPSIMED